ncbi:MAG: DUF885 domain-containing protein [Candidatus Zixiibacteriota bacterium]
MIRRGFTVLTAFLLTAFIAQPSATAKKQALNELGLDVLEALQSFYPVQSTEMGIHSYDHRLADYSPGSVKKMIKQLKDYEKIIYRYKDASLSDYDRVNYKLIKSNVDAALLALDRIRWHTKSPQLYVDEAVNGVYFLLLSQHAPMSEKLVPLLARMRDVPNLFATARRNVKHPPAVYTEAALESLESGVQFYREAAAELMKEFSERADEILEASTLAREAMNDFATYLREITPGDETAFAIGRENFDYLLSHQYFLPFDSDSLLKIGEALLAEAQAAYRDYEAYVENNHQSGRDSVFVPAVFTKQDILDYYNWETDQIRIFLEENNVVTVPEDIAPVKVIETPSFLRTMIGGIAYQPAGPFDTVQQAFFYVRPIPDDLDRKQLEARYRFVHRRGFRGSVVHEAYPGHHLQMQLAGRHHDPVRKWQMNWMFIEGWALYCEEMMYVSGLFGEEDPGQWLAVLGGIRFRAARIVADVKLHTGQFTYDDCVAWMIDALDIETEASKEYIRKEVRRYTHTPTYQMAYLMGKREILALRAAAEERDGEDFSLNEFHNSLLAHGSIPPTLLWEVMDLRSPESP